MQYIKPMLSIRLQESKYVDFLVLEVEEYNALSEFAELLSHLPFAFASICDDEASTWTIRSEKPDLTAMVEAYDHWLLDERRPFGTNANR